MATYQVLYWQDIPAQVKAEDDADEVSLPLAPRFMERIDEVAVRTGLSGSDDYIAQWKWSDLQQRDGSAQEVAEAVRDELESRADW